MSWQSRDRVDETDVVLRLFTKPEDATSADMDASFLDVADGSETLVVGASRDDAGVVFPRSVHVVVVRRQASIFEFFCLRGINHAQRDAGLHAQGADALDHLLDVPQVRLAATHVAPGGAHAEARAAVFFGHSGRFEHGFNVHDLGGFEARVVTGRLGTVAAVFAAASRLDVHQSTHLDRGGVVEATVDGSLLKLVVLSGTT